MRTFVSNQDKIRSAPVIFLGKLSASVEVAPPVKENVLYAKTLALRLQFSNVIQWKPDTVERERSVYTWTRSESACPGFVLDVGKHYIVFGEFDSSGKFILADSCRSIIDAMTEDGKSLVKEIEDTFGKAK